MTPSKTSRNHSRRILVGKSRTCRPGLRKSAPFVEETMPQEPVSRAVAANIRQILSVASTVASMPNREAMQRYHELVDKELVYSLTPSERFELERIEARLDAGERDTRIEVQNKRMEAERARILDSIQTLLAGLKQ